MDKIGWKPGLLATVWVITTMGAALFSFWYGCQSGEARTLEILRRSKGEWRTGDHVNLGIEFEKLSWR